MQLQNLLTRKRVAIILVLLGSLIFMSLFFFRGTGAINPKGDKLRKPDEGKHYAAVYKIADLYSAIDKNDNVLRAVQNDLMLFARTTRPEFADTDTLVGFTFNKGAKKEGQTTVMTGYYYGLNDKIEVKVTPHGKGVYTLNITNLTDSTNIDESLSLNGKRNQYITTLPIENDKYSIRYQLTEDRIVATFYEGYTKSDINAVVASVTAGLGTAENGDVVYSINGVGIFPLSKVRENLINPIQQN